MPKSNKPQGARQPASRTRRTEPQAPRNPHGQSHSGKGRVPRHPADEFSNRPPQSRPAAPPRSAPPAASSPAARPEGTTPRTSTARPAAATDARRSATRPAAATGTRSPFARPAAATGARTSTARPAATDARRADAHPAAATGARPPAAGGRSPRTGAAGTTAEGVPFTPRAPKQRVQRAKKMALRHGSVKVEKQSRELREKRVETRYLEDMRLQKALALTGLGSRREMEDLIAAGKVEVNGKVAELGCKISPEDKIRLNGKPVFVKWPDRLPRILIYHKQEGEIVTRDDPQGRVTIFDRLPQTKSSKWIAIGRLDVNTSGLMIVTTSGELANRMMHPSFEVEREYAVRAFGELTAEQMTQLTQGVELEDGPAHFQFISDQGGEGQNRWYRVILREGRNREVRRLFEFCGLVVSRLIRVRYGTLTLPTRLKRGQWVELGETEVADVLKWADLTLAGGVKPR